MATTLHFVLFPLLAQGHMIPMVDIGRMLAHRGATVTIITTPLNAKRYKQVIARAIHQDNLKIQVLELHLRLSEVGLPEGCESFDMLPSLALGFHLISAMELLEEPAENLLRQLSPPPDCIISDSFFPWTMDVARRFNIPRLLFYGPGCFWLLCHHILFSDNMLAMIESNSDYFVVPGLPDRIEVTKLQVSAMEESGTAEAKRFFARMKEAEKDTYGIVINSFEELEFKYAQEIPKAKGKKVWCIGPVSLYNKRNLDIAERGNRAAINEQDFLKWLDSKEAGSVVYVCLGSLTSASTEQAIEIGLGLELTKRPFIWCIRNKSEELERWFLEEGFKERVKDRGLIVFGWAPQVLILSHWAIGGFVTHCGWNSTLEAVCAGVPMVTWPHFGDQFLNERFVVQVLKIGVRIGVEIPVVFGVEDEGGELQVKKEDVERSVGSLMEEEGEGKERRKRARELGGMAKKAMEKEGSSHINMTSMIQDITLYLANNMKSSFE